MANVELIAILRRWNACEIGPDEVEQELRQVLADKPTPDWRPSSVQQLAAMMGMRSSLARSPIVSGITKSGPAIQAGGANVAISIGALDQYLATYDPAVGGLAYVRDANPLTYELMHPKLRALSTHPLPEILLTFTPR